MRVERSGRMAVTGDSLGGPGRRLLKDQRVIGYGGRDCQRCFVVVCILCSFNRLLWVCPFFLSHYYLASRFRRSRIRAHRLWLMRCRWKSMRRWRRALQPNSRFQVAVLGYIYWYRLLGRWARVIMSSRRSVILLFCHSAVLSICCFVNLSVCKLELRHSVWYLVCPPWHFVSFIMTYYPSLLWYSVSLYSAWGSWGDSASSRATCIMDSGESVMSRASCTMDSGGLGEFPASRASSTREMVVIWGLPWIWVSGMW